MEKGPTSDDLSAAIYDIVAEEFLRRSDYTRDVATSVIAEPVGAPGGQPWVSFGREMRSTGNNPPRQDTGRLIGGISTAVVRDGGVPVFELWNEVPYAATLEYGTFSKAGAMRGFRPDGYVPHPLPRPWFAETQKAIVWLWSQP